MFRMNQSKRRNRMCIKDIRNMECSSKFGQSQVSSGKIGRARVNTDNTDRSNTLFYVYSLLYSLLCFRQSEKILLKIQKN